MGNSWYGSPNRVIEMTSKGEEYLEALEMDPEVVAVDMRKSARYSLLGALASVFGGLADRYVLLDTLDELIADGSSGKKILRAVSARQLQSLIDEGYIDEGFDEAEVYYGSGGPLDTREVM